MNPLLSVVLCIVSLFLSIFDYPTYPYGKTVDMSKFVLTFSDEFDGDSLNTDIWAKNVAHNTSVRRGGYWNTDMASVKDGKLHIATKYFPDGYKGGKPGWYTCQLTTRDTFQQCKGYFETRCILPKGYGLWGAFWLFGHGVGKIGNGGRDGAEIDIFESAFYSQRGIAHNAVSSAVHFDGYGAEHQQRLIKKYMPYGSDPYEEFNTYALEWNDTAYTLYVNGVKVGSSHFGGISQDEQWVILSVEVGGNNGVPSDSWVGPDITTNAENEITDFIVDYVRVYQYK